MFIDFGKIYKIMNLSYFTSRKKRITLYLAFFISERKMTTTTEYPNYIKKIFYSGFFT